MSLQDTLLRLLPHATRPGLRRIGQPGPSDPVVVTGNYALTVRRLTRRLDGQNAWLLVTNSNGINVWCAAGGGHLTHHDVIAAIRASALSEQVEHRQLILPQLAATGIEPRRIQESTGWRSQWGPARLEDLPAFLDRGHAARRERVMRFPLWERLEMALMWVLPLAIMAALAVGLPLGWIAGGVTALSVSVAILGTFAALPWLEVTGARRWLTFAGTAALGSGLGLAALRWLGAADPVALAALAAACLLAALALSIELAGTTPWYPSSANAFGQVLRVELLEQRCTGAATCVQVCPRDVLRVHEHQVAFVRPDDCILCGACIVQCPDDALRFRFEDGRVVEPATVRSTRLNLLGKRAIRVE